MYSKGKVSGWGFPASMESMPGLVSEENRAHTKVKCKIKEGKS
jgi:hypothetical protein